MIRKLNPQALAEAQNLYHQSQIAAMVFQSYIKGCMAAMGLKGDWNFNPEIGEFQEVKDDAAN